MQADAELKTHPWSMLDLEFLNDSEQFQGHQCDLSHVSLAISLGHPTAYHIGVSNCLNLQGTPWCELLGKNLSYFIDIPGVDDAIKECVEIIEEMDDLERCTL